MPRGGAWLGLQCHPPQIEQDCNTCRRTVAHVAILALIGHVASFLGEYHSVYAGLGNPLAFIMLIFFLMMSAIFCIACARVILSGNVAESRQWYYVGMITGGVGRVLGSVMFPSIKRTMANVLMSFYIQAAGCGQVSFLVVGFMRLPEMLTVLLRMKFESSGLPDSETYLQALVYMFVSLALVVMSSVVMFHSRFRMFNARVAPAPEPQPLEPVLIGAPSGTADAVAKAREVGTADDGVNMVESASPELASSLANETGVLDTESQGTEETSQTYRSTQTLADMVSQQMQALLQNHLRNVVRQYFPGFIPGAGWYGWGTVASVWGPPSVLNDDRVAFAPEPRPM